VKLRRDSCPDVGGKCFVRAHRLVAQESDAVDVAGDLRLVRDFTRLDTTAVQAFVAPFVGGS